MLSATLFVWALEADLEVARLVYVENEQWPGIESFPWDFIYHYAVLPSLLMAGASLIILLLGFIYRSMAQYRMQTLFMVLLMLLGPGLVVNVLLKDNMGRARPREIVEFGGQHQFTQIWQKGDTGKNSSFPSGHAAGAFYLIAPWFLLRRKKPGPAAACLIFGLAYGSLVGAARIMQGGHFLSDVIWAGGLVYLAGEILVRLLRLEDQQPGSLFE